ncbi:hypothetical protein BJX65DRAFT_1254 [Aspergillus insuetus]
MIFLNVTNPGNYNGSGDSAFSYLNSHVGKTFRLIREGETTSSLRFLPYMSLQAFTSYGEYLQGTDHAYTGVNSSDPALEDLNQPRPTIYSNPFHIDDRNFTPAVPLCRRTTQDDYANISNIAVGCGMVYGVPQRQNAGDPLISALLLRNGR